MQDVAKPDAGSGWPSVDVWDLLRSSGQFGGSAKVFNE